MAETVELYDDSMITNDPYDLQRFVTAQAPVYEAVLRELREGRKRTHWIWFIFPQLRGLGSSWNAEFYGMDCAEEAAEYLRHPILGSRLRECVQTLLQLPDGTLRQVLGSPDDLKFCSSMTLFAHATPDRQLFIDALTRFCSGRYDQRTLDRL